MATPSPEQPASSTPRRPERLTPDDDLFVRMEHALGLPAVNQCVWRLRPPAGAGNSEVIDVAGLHRLADGLSRGRMSRLVVRSRLPVRDRWVHSTRAGARHFDTEPIPAADILTWARTQCAYPLDTGQGPAWRLSAVPTDTGETIVSLVASHVIADGGAGLSAVVEALLEIPYHRRDVPSSLPDTLRDGATTLADAARAMVTLLRRDNTPTVPRPAPRPATAPDSDSAGPATKPSSTSTPPTATAPTAAPTPTAIVSVAAADFDRVATTANGTANSLFIALVVGVLEATGRISTGDVVPVSLPVSTRTAHDRRANATTGVTAAVEVTDDRYADLAPIRAASKSAFAGLGSGPGPLELMSRAAQPLGDSIVGRLVADSTLPLCLASNLGELPATYASLGTAAVGHAAMRSLPVAASTEQLRRMDGGISGWCSRGAGQVTLSFAALDPDRVADDQALSALIVDELARWGLVGTSWAEQAAGAHDQSAESGNPQ